MSMGFFRITLRRREALGVCVFRIQNTMYAQAGTVVLEIE